MVSELCLEMLWGASYDLSKFSTFWFVLKAFRATTLVDIATLNLFVSNGVGVTSGDSLEPEFVLGKNMAPSRGGNEHGKKVGRKHGPVSWRAGGTGPLKGCALPPTP